VTKLTLATSLTSRDQAPLDFEKELPISEPSALERSQEAAQIGEDQSRSTLSRIDYVWDRLSPAHCQATTGLWFYDTPLVQSRARQGQPEAASRNLPARMRNA
jgi:hypothetical protein